MVPRSKSKLYKASALRSKKRQLMEKGYRPPGLQDLLWEDIHCRHLLPYLPLRDLFQLRGVSLGLRQLVDLFFSLASNVHISKDVAQKFSSEAFRVLTQGTHSLSELSVHGAGLWLTGDVLMSVLDNNPGLVTVDLPECHFLSNADVSAVFESCLDLHSLNLAQCYQLTGQAFQVFVNNHPTRLVDVNLGGCRGLAEDDVIRLVMNSQGLKVLILDEMHQITNHTVAMVSKHCPGLERLNISTSCLPTDHCIQMLAEYCPKLNHLEVKHCQRVTEDSLAPLRRRGIRIDRPPQVSHQHRLHMVPYQI